MRVTPAAYAQLVWSLSSLAGGRLVVMLEGGYCLDSLAESAALTLRALLGKQILLFYSNTGQLIL
jgi:histone deacetylase 6